MKNYAGMSRAELERELDSLLAEKKASANPSRSGAAPAPDDLQHLMHELQIHQIELEMQNRDLQQAHKELEEARDRCAGLYDFAPIGYVTLDDKGNIKEINLKAAEMLGKERSSLIGKPFVACVVKRDADRFLDHIKRCRQTGEKVSTELGLAVRGGEPVEVQMLSVPVRNAWQQAALYRTAIADISGRKRAEDQLRESEAKLSGIIQSAMDGIITIDEKQRVVLFNEAAEKLFQCTAAEAIGQTIDRFIPESFRADHRKHVKKFGQTHVTQRSMGKLGGVFGLRADGEVFPVEASISQVEVRGEKFYTVILRDITRRIWTEEHLREQAALLDQARDAILVRDLDDHIIYWNKSAERIYGWAAAETIGKTVQNLHLSGNAAQVEKAKRILMDKGEWTGELENITKGGKKIIVESHWTLTYDTEGKPKSTLVINTDITEKKLLEAQFLRAQRMESIGTLAGGIAHDINNVLSPVLTAIQMFQMKLRDEESRRMLAMLQETVERGGELVKQVLEFAKGVDGERMVIQLKHLVKEMERILKETFPKTIDISSVVVGDSWPIIGDPTQLHQVLMNLCVNARDAMPRGGRLSIKVENSWIDENYARMYLDASPGRFALIKVSDTGAGISADIEDKIFDPFFTTKERGKGTGLGLSTALTIVKSHGGFINVQSEPGEGTVFEIYLPAAESPMAKEAEEKKAGLPAGHGELILVVDDEAAIREITRNALETFGYRALTANDGIEALALYAQKKDEISVVLIDMVMPEMDGPATIRALKKMDPQVRIIASSGHASKADMARAADAGVKSFLSKPYTAESLLKALAEILTTEQ